MRSRSCRVLVGALVVLLGWAAAPAASGSTTQSAAPTPVRYQPPVGPPDAVIIGHFRPPPTPYASGDRGVDYATVAGTPVQASAGGRVLFAGPVAGTLAITLVHADGLRTSYSFLASVAVAAGDEVAQGQVIATTGTFFHFGVRDPTGTYLDPEQLFAGRIGVHLVPGADDGRAPLGAGGFSIAGELQALLGVVADHVAASGSPSLLALSHELLALSRRCHWRRWPPSWRTGDGPSRAAPRPGCRRRHHPVAASRCWWRGSGRRHEGVDRRRGHHHVGLRVRRRSPLLVQRWPGGRSPGRARWCGRPVPPSAYGPRTPRPTFAPWPTVGRLLDRLAAWPRGVPIDVIAHSQGRRRAPGAHPGHGSRRSARPAGDGGHMSSPHQGTDLATGQAASRARPSGCWPARDPRGRPAAARARQHLAGPAEPDLGPQPGTRQPLPAGLHVLSIEAMATRSCPGSDADAGRGPARHPHERVRHPRRPSGIGRRHPGDRLARAGMGTTSWDWPRASPWS